MGVRHARWVEFLQAYTSVIRRKAAGILNQVADAWSRRRSSLISMQVKVLRFEVVKKTVQR